MNEQTVTFRIKNNTFDVLKNVNILDAQSYNANVNISILTGTKDFKDSFFDFIEYLKNNSLRMTKIEMEIFHEYKPFVARQLLEYVNYHASNFSGDYFGFKKTPEIITQNKGVIDKIDLYITDRSMLSFEYLAPKIEIKLSITGKFPSSVKNHEQTETAYEKKTREILNPEKPKIEPGTVTP